MSILINLTQMDGDGYVPSSAVGIDSTAISNDTIVNADINSAAAIDHSKLAALTSGNILVGSAGNVATSVNPSGDIDVTNTGVFSISSGVVVNADVADGTGTAELSLPKSAKVVYDFAVDGGVAGTIALTGAPTIPDKAVVWVEAYDVLTTCTSATDAATIALQLPTDGVLTTAIAISNGANPWDAGVAISTTKGLATPLPKKCTAARVPSLLVAGGENLTAGKIVFYLRYFVSQ